MERKKEQSSAPTGQGIEADQGKIIMAAQRTEKQHAFIRIEKDIKAGKVPRLVLLCGAEEFLVNHYRSRLVKAFINPASEALDLTEYYADEINTDGVVEAAETLPLLSEKKVILLQSIVDRHGKFPKAYRKDEESLEDLLAYFNNIPEGALVLLTCESPQTTGDYNKQSDGRNLKKLSAAVRKAGGEVYDFNRLNHEQLRGFVIKRFQRAGKTCDRRVLNRIMNDTGYENRYVDYDLFALENDLRKIIAHSGMKEKITERDLEGVLTVSPENSVFRMLGAIGQGRKDQALIHLNTLLEEGESLFGILKITVRQLDMMLVARQLQDEGRSRDQIISYINREEKIRGDRARIGVDTAARIPSARLRHMLLESLAVEKHIKGGLMEGRLAMEYFISVC